MKIFNKFANKNAGKPGVFRRWGGGLLSLYPLFVSVLLGHQLTYPTFFFCDEFSRDITNLEAFKLGQSIALQGDPGPMHWVSFYGPPQAGSWLPDAMPVPVSLKTRDDNSMLHGEKISPLMEPLMGVSGRHYCGDGIPFGNDTWIDGVVAGWWYEATKPGYLGIGIAKMRSEIESLYMPRLWKTILLGTAVGLGLLGTYLFKRYSNKSSSKLTVLHLE
ncbi:MAG: hypothetical protein LBJ77_01370 [Holosporales bacterium]|jgi:hypothetical protein|nr:hypothetical protein [Holosporales bacterium]